MPTPIPVNETNALLQQLISEVNTTNSQLKQVSELVTFAINDVSNMIAQIAGDVRARLEGIK